MDKIKIAHGSGGQYTYQLINDVFVKHFDNPILKQKDDSAILPRKNLRPVFTTDTHVVKPLFFPGGDIGKLAVTGTLNDLAVMGAHPAWLSCGMIIEEGFAIDDLEKIVISMARTADEENVKIVTGDTKVIEKGSCDGIFINTTGMGHLADSINFGVNQLESGDKILINGNIGEHAAAIITARQNFDIRFKTQSDCACVYSLIEKLTDELENIKIMRDPTRGGLATTLNEFVMEQRVGIKIDEEKIPIREQIKGFCEPLGFDPLYLANEGKFITIVKDNEAQKALSIMKSHDLGQNATILGEVTSQNPGRVILKTTIGSTRVLDMMSGEMLPRIC